MSKKNGSKAEVESQSADYLQWVGSMFYPTYGDFIQEARNRGVCKRIGKLPNNLVPGESRIFLAHDDGLVGDGFIFGYFIPDRIEFLADNESDIPEPVFDRIEWVSEWRSEKDRDCGQRDEGMYLSSQSKTDNGTLVVFKYPRTLESFDPGRKHFRGLLAISYGNKLMRTPRSNTMLPPSRSKFTPKVVDDDYIEDKMLAGFEEDKSTSRIAQELAFETGQKKSSILYRWLKMQEING